MLRLRFDEQADAGDAALRAVVSRLLAFEPGLILPLVTRHASRYFRLLLEKVPFLALAILDCFITFVVQKRGGSLGVGSTFPLRSALREHHWSPTAANWENCSGRRIWRFSIRIRAIGRWRRCCWRADFSHCHSLFSGDAAAPSVFADGLALVLRDAGAGDRFGADRTAGDGRPAYLFAVAGSFHPGRLGCG